MNAIKFWIGEPRLGSASPNSSTNILVSAVLKGRKSREIIQFICDSFDLNWLVFQEILAEYREVLNRRKLKLTDEVRQEWLDKIETIPKLIEVNVTVDFTRDPKDAKFIASARVSEADFLITGDRDFNEMIELKKTVIISVSLFYDLLIGQQAMSKKTFMFFF